MRVLFTTPILEYPPAGGPQLRIANSIKALSRVCELSVVVRTSRQLIGGDGAERYYSQFCRELIYIPAGLRLSSNRYIRRTQRTWHALREHVSRKEARSLLTLARARRVDALWFGYGNISFPLIKAVKAIEPEIKVVCDTDSVWSRFVLRELPFQSNPFRRWVVKRSGERKRREEQEWVKLCEVTTAVSDVDADYYRALAADPAHIRTFSNVIDLDSYANPPAPAPDVTRPNIYLAGTFGRYHSPMDVAARWMLSDVLPRVKKDLPDVHFYIVGSGSRSSLGYVDDEGVSVKGKIPSVLPYLCHADVSVVPLKFESGTRFKILEAAACGVPVVSTTLGAEGLPVVNGEHLLIADDPDTFANAIVSLIRDRALAAKLRKNCRELVRTRYGLDRLADEARTILESLERV